MLDVVQSIITQTHWKLKTAENRHKAMRVRFRLRPTHMEDYHEDYYPRVDLIIWSPTNYTKVLVQESDPHHFGAGPVVMVADHDSEWRSGVSRVLEYYEQAIADVDSLGGWYEMVDAEEAWKDLEWSRPKDARFLPHLRGDIDPVPTPPSIYNRD